MQLNIMLYIHCPSCSILQLHHCRNKILFSLILLRINKILAWNNDCVLKHFDQRLQCKTLYEISNTTYHNYIIIFNWNVQEIHWYTMLAWSSQLMTWIMTTGMMGTVQSPIPAHGGTMDVTPGICNTWMRKLYSNAEGTAAYACQSVLRLYLITYYHSTQNTSILQLSFNYDFTDDSAKTDICWKMTCKWGVDIYMQTMMVCY